MDGAEHKRGICQRRKRIVELAGNINGFWGVKICLVGKKIKKVQIMERKNDGKSKGFFFLSVKERSVVVHHS